ncbi:MAG: hypothetical protein A2Z25_09805 [Planctomycetes bacterium RBG_16_55_9]|nr:MAG: hypothetical protein A2Z25_09805 [Planctomycetes bacterium RBG_16_55_9]
MRRVISYTLILALMVGFAADVTDAKLVACVGDSITYGSGIADRAKDSYPAQLGRLLREFDPQWQTQNFGVSGATLLRKGDKPYVQQSAYNQALAAKPDVVIIKLGTNDSKSWNWVYKEEFVSDYLYLIDAFAALPSAPEIWICKPVPAFTDNFGITNAVIHDEVIPFIDEIAQQRDVGVIDLYTALSGAAGLFPDGIHPNAQGAGMIAEAIVDVLIGLRALPDFNGDAKVDFRDFARLAQSWLENDPMLDIAPPPDVDGIVDYRDLAGLAEYWLKEIGLVAHWPLDEREGEVAGDNAADHHGTLHGDPVWQPEDGVIAGALLLDGLDDYVSTAYVSNPAERPFSVFAWIKGGAPGQVVVAQKDEANWLGAAPVEGYLMTGLKFPGRSGAPVVSQTVVTDGQWHRIGFAWDGSHRMLYVDDVVVAEDTQDSLGGSREGLYFGAGYGLQPETFWSGLIDDIRVYNRAVSP